jgi:hypothetical protein
MHCFPTLASSGTLPGSLRGLYSLQPR